MVISYCCCNLKTGMVMMGGGRGEEEINKNHLESNDPRDIFCEVNIFNSALFGCTLQDNEAHYLADVRISKKTRIGILDNLERFKVNSAFIFRYDFSRPRFTLVYNVAFSLYEKGRRFTKRRGEIWRDEAAQN